MSNDGTPVKFGPQAPPAPGFADPKWPSLLVEHDPAKGDIIPELPPMAPHPQPMKITEK